MSRAESHEVGGEGSEFSKLVGGEGTSQENGEAGAGEGLSLRVMVRDRNGPFESQVRDHMVNVIVTCGTPPSCTYLPQINGGVEFRENNNREGERELIGRGQ